MASPTPTDLRTGYRHTLLWNIGFSAYWFASSYKWFILLFVLLPDIVSHIVPGGEKNFWWGIVFGIGALWAIIGPPIFGRLNETLNGVWRFRQPWILMGSGLTVIGLFLVMGANSIWTLSIGYFALQIGDDIGTGPYAGMVADTVPEDNRGYASSVMGVLRLFGQIASAIAGLILKNTALILVGIAVVNVLCALWTSWTIRTVPPQEDPGKERGSFVHDWVEPFKSRDFLLVWINRFIVSLAFALVAAYTLNYLKDMFSSYVFFGKNLKDAKMAANIIALTLSFAGMLGSAYSARVSDRLGRKPLLIASGLIIFLCLIPVAFLRDFTPIWICVFVYGVGYGIYVAADWALIGDVLPNKDKAATEMGVWHASEVSAQLFGGSAGIFIDLMNRQANGLGYQAMVLTSATLYLISTFLVRGIKGSR